MDDDPFEDAAGPEMVNERDFEADDEQADEGNEPEMGDQQGSGFESDEQLPPDDVQPSSENHDRSGTDGSRTFDERGFDEHGFDRNWNWDESRS